MDPDHDLPTKILNPSGMCLGSHANFGVLLTDLHLNAFFESFHLLSTGSFALTILNPFPSPRIVLRGIAEFASTDPSTELAIVATNIYQKILRRLYDTMCTVYTVHVGLKTPSSHPFPPLPLFELHEILVNEVLPAE